MMCLTCLLGTFATRNQLRIESVQDRVKELDIIKRVLGDKCYGSTPQPFFTMQMLLPLSKICSSLVVFRPSGVFSLLGGIK